MLNRLFSIILSFVLILTQLPLASLYAHDGTLPSGVITGPGSEATSSPTNPPPGGTEGGKGDQTGDTDPLLLQQGDFRFEARDLLIPGRGIPIEIKRTYRSRSRYNAMFGYGWDFNFNIRLRKHSNGDVTILTGDNRRNEFKKSGSSFTSPPGIYDTLTQELDGSFTLTSKHALKQTFDPDGKFISMSDRNGNTITFTYDPQGKLPVIGTSPYFVGQTSGVVVMDWRLTRITDTVGRNIDLLYDSNGRLSKIKDFTGRILIYQYSSAGDLISFAKAPPEGLGPGETLMGYKTTYTYTTHNLERITDAKGKKYLTNVYDENDRVTQQTYGDPLESGGVSTITYEPLANQTTVIDRKGFKTIWTFNEDGNPIRKEVFTKAVRPGDPASYLTLYEYNSNLELTKITYPKGNITENTYDTKGNLLEIRRKGEGNPDIVTAFTYEPEYNQVKTIQDPRGNTTTYTYDYELGEPQKGNLRKITFPQVDGQTIESVFTYNSFGQLETAQDPNGNITKYEYFPATGYLQKITNGFGTVDASTTQMTYDAVGNVQTLVDPRANTTSFTYDVNNNLKQVTAPAPFNYLTKYTYDLNGNLEKLERQAPFGFQTTTYTYTALDQLKTITDHQSNITQFQYDANGNRTKITDAELKETNYLYDERDLLFKVTDANNGITTYSYDANGNLTSIKDANTNTTQYQYDEFDRLTSTVYPDASSESYTYDAASNLKTKTDPKSQVIQYDYDELNRLTFKTYTGCAISVCGGNVDYLYDEGSRLDLVSNSLTSIDYNYDSLNRVKDVTTTLAASPFTLHYEYDAAGNRTQLTYPHGRVVNYTYDELNRLDQIKNQSDQVLYDFDYDELSRRTSLSRPNSVTTTYAYDTLNRLTQMNHGSVGSISYPLYDKVGNRRQMSDVRGQMNYTYNNIYELSSVTGALSESYNYDSVGNRTSASATNTPSSYTPNNLNQYTQVDAATYSYDLNGNLTSDTDQIYEYDFENRLTRVTPAPPNTSLRGGAADEAIYQYDPLGRRLSKTVNSETTWFLYDFEDILEVRDSSLNLKTSFLHGPEIDDPLELVEHPSSTTYYYHHDGLGSIVHLTNGTGTTQESYTYDAYGIPSNTSSLGNPFLFTGREYDSETGLYFYRMRHYSPNLGRFLQRDSLGESVDSNLYRYVENNPIYWVDPSGLDRQPWWATAIDVASGVLTAIDLITFGPTGEGIGPAIALQAAKAGLRRRGAVVIGENMVKRVIPAAKKYGASFYKPLQTLHEVGLNKALRMNRHWVAQQIREGKRIIDIGIDMGRNALGRSPFYRTEVEFVKKVVERGIKVFLEKGSL